MLFPHNQQSRTVEPLPENDNIRYTISPPALMGVPGKRRTRMEIRNE